MRRHSEASTKRATGIPARDASQTSHRRPQEARLAYVHVLVVDDNLDAREILRTFLEHHGAFVRVAASVEQAIETLQHVTPDLVITDLSMPGMDGRALLRSIRKSARGIATPVIAWTAYPKQYRRSLPAFDAYLTKPSELAVLLDVVARFVGR
jgi:CheY-like chemotaxis protein